MSQYNSATGAARYQVAASIVIGGLAPWQSAVLGYNDLTAGPTDFSSLLAPLYPPIFWAPNYYTVQGACVAAGTGPGTIAPNIGNNQYTVGFFPWQHDSVYARNVDVATGVLTLPGQCYLINDPTTSVDYKWDFNQSLAVTNCSNTGRDLMCMWFDGTAMQYKYSTPNVMAFKNGKNAGNGAVDAPLAGKSKAFASITPAISPIPAKNQLVLRGIDGSFSSIVRDLQGRSVLIHKGGDIIDVAGLSPGSYTISATSIAGNPVTLKFTKL